MTDERYIFWDLDVFFKMTVYTKTSIRLTSIIKGNTKKYMTQLITQVLWKGVFNTVIQDL